LAADGAQNNPDQYSILQREITAHHLREANLSDFLFGEIITHKKDVL
jgi:hypothetical protein